MDHGLNSGDIITYKADLLHRQIPASWIQAGRPCEQAFRPQERDDDGLSVYWGRLVSPENSFKLHQSNNFKTARVYSVTIAECQGADLPVFFDPLEINPFHSIVNYKGVMSKKDKKIKGLMLRDFALIRGATFVPSSDEPLAESMPPTT